MYNVKMRQLFRIKSNSFNESENKEMLKLHCLITLEDLKACAAPRGDKLF